MNVAASTGIGGRALQYAHLTWMVAVAAIAVVVGFSTLNMMLADSGLAVLNEHAAPFMTLFARLTRQA